MSVGQGMQGREWVGAYRQLAISADVLSNIQPGSVTGFSQGGRLWFPSIWLRSA